MALRGVRRGGGVTWDTWEWGYRGEEMGRLVLTLMLETVGDVETVSGGNSR